MNQKAQFGTGQDTHNGIVVLLLALADLADRAAGAPFLVRWRVLLVLRHAEVVVLDFVAQAPCVARRKGSPGLVPVRDGFEPADAMNQATSLRMLAIIVRAMAASGIGPADPDPAFRQCRRLGHARQTPCQRVSDLSMAAASSAETCDTSSAALPQCFLDSSFVAFSNPCRVSGYIRSANRSLIIWIECV